MDDLYDIGNAYSKGKWTNSFTFRQGFDHNYWLLLLLLVVILSMSTAVEWCVFTCNQIMSITGTQHAFFALKKRNRKHITPFYRIRESIVAYMIIFYIVILSVQCALCTVWCVRFSPFGCNKMNCSFISQIFQAAHVICHIALMHFM